MPIFFPKSRNFSKIKIPNSIFIKNSNKVNKKKAKIPLFF